MFLLPPPLTPPPRLRFGFHPLSQTDWVSAYYFLLPRFLVNSGPPGPASIESGLPNRKLPEREVSFSLLRSFDRRTALLKAITLFFHLPATPR